MTNAQIAYRRALENDRRAQARMSHAFARAHDLPKIDLELAWLASLDAQAREARAFKRLVRG